MAKRSRQKHEHLTGLRDRTFACALAVWRRFETHPLTPQSSLFVEFLNDIMRLRARGLREGSKIPCDYVHLCTLSTLSILSLDPLANPLT